MGFLVLRRTIAPTRNCIALSILLFLLLTTQSFAGLYTAFGPEIYIRSTGKPFAVIKTFSALNPNTTYILRIENGGLEDDELEHVSSSVFILNGTEIVSPNEFNQNVAVIEKPITLSTTNELSVELRGKPDGVLTVNIFGIDDDPPTIRASANPLPNLAGWNNVDVTGTFECFDVISGIASCPDPVVVSMEGAAQVITGTAVDNAGNSASASVTINLDKTPPTLTSSLTPLPNPAGWNNSDTTVSYFATDVLSGIDTISSPTIITIEGAGQVVTGTATDIAGNAASFDVTVNLDKTAPTITVTSVPLSNTNGWNNSDVTVSFAATDGLSGIGDVSQPVTLSSEGSNQLVGGTATDIADNTASTSISINIDKTPPTLASVLSPLPNSAGWNNADTTLSFTASDLLSGVGTVSSPTTITIEGEGQVVTGTATDLADNATTFDVTVNLDKTAPTITGVSAPLSNANGWNNSDVTVSFSATDALSGIDTVSPPTTLTTEGANQLVSGSATDLAGNSASTSITLNLDKTPPVLTLSSPNDGEKFFTSPATVTGSANDLLSGMATLSCNGNAVSPPSGNFSCDLPLTEGPNPILVVAQDLADNTQSSAITVAFISNTPPIANAGADFAVLRENTTTLDGTASSDLEDDPLTYLWSFVSRPAGSTATLSNATSETPNLTMDIAGTYVLQLVVNDGTENSVADTVRVTSSAWVEVSITSPFNGDILTTSPTAVTGTVDDPQATVVVNGVVATVATDGSFVASGIRLIEGFNPITAQATNLSGQTDNDTVIVTHEPAPGSLGITVLGPIDNAVLETNRFDVDGLVTDPTATVLVNQDTLATRDEDLFNAGIYICGGSAAEFGCNLTITAYGEEGQITTTTQTFTPSLEAKPLEISITSPVGDQLIRHSPVQVTGTVKDIFAELGLGSSVITVNGVTATVQDGTFSAEVPLVDGTNVITALAESAVVHNTHRIVRVLLESFDKPLSVQVTVPVDPFIVNHTPIPVSGLVSDSTAIVDVNGITAELDFRSFEAASVPLSLGANILTITATRPDGETVTSPLTVTYDPDAPIPPPPVLNPLPPIAGRDCSFLTCYQRFLVTGRSEPFLDIDIIVNGIIQLRTQADTEGLFETEVRLGLEGPNHISARALDINGNASDPSSEATVIRDSIIPDVSFFFGNRSFGFPLNFLEILGFTEPFADVEITLYNDLPAYYQVTADVRGRFSFTTNINAGEHAIQIEATDAAGNTGRNLRSFFPMVSPQDIITIDPIPSQINASSIAVEGNAYRFGEIELFMNGALFGTVKADVRGRYRFEDVSLVQGAHTLKVRQKEYQFGRHGGLLFWEPPARFLDPKESAEVIVGVVTETPAIPQVNITFPVDGAVTNAEFLPIRGTISDPFAELRVNGTYYANGTAENHGATFVSDRKIPLVPGENILWVEAIAPDGSRGVDKITVTSNKDAQVPSVLFTNPADDDEVFDRFISTNGTIDPSVQTVIVNEVDAPINQGSFISDFFFLDLRSRYVDDPNHPGKAVITAWAMDDQGRIGSHHIGVHYQFVAVPFMSRIRPINGEVVTTSPITVTGNVFDASEVIVNGRTAQMEENSFSVPIDLVEGENAINIIAKNGVKAQARTLTLDYQPSEIVSLAIESEKNVIVLGELLQLKAIGTRSDGTVIDLTSQALWTSSSPKVATVNASGFVTSISPFEPRFTIINASFEGLSANISITVDLPALQSIELAHMEVFLTISIDPVVSLNPTPSLEVGETLELVPLGTFSNGGVADLRNPNSSRPLPTYESSDPSVATLDSFGVVTALQTGTTVISASLEGVIGTTTLNVVPPPMFLFIDDPLTGSAVSSDKITVRGTVISGASEVGVTVNDLQAHIFGNQFVVNGVPLVLGTNSLVAEGIDSNGAVASSLVEVDSFPAPDGITLRSNVQSGVAPLEITLEIDSTFGSFPESTLFSDGPDVPEVTPVSPEEYQVTMTTEGIYDFTAEVTDDLGTTHRDTLGIVVFDFDEMDALLRAKWEGMKAALIVGDIATALSYLSEAVRERYELSFIDLGADLPQSLAAVEEFHLLNSLGELIEAEVIRIENGIRYSYPVFFVRGEDGQWRIQTF